MRVPDDALCRALLARTGPLAVTSANLHGVAPATTAAGVAAVAEGVAAVFDGGTRDGAVSTVVDLTGATPLLVREGALAFAELLERAQRTLSTSPRTSTVASSGSAASIDAASAASSLATIRRAPLGVRSDAMARVGPAPRSWPTV